MCCVAFRNKDLKSNNCAIDHLIFGQNPLEPIIWERETCHTKSNSQISRFIFFKMVMDSHFIPFLYHVNKTNHVRQKHLGEEYFLTGLDIDMEITLLISVEFSSVPKYLEKKFLEDC